MSDPSSNLNTYVRSWKSKQDIKKSQSETEVDYYSNGITEIEAGDIRDGNLYFNIMIYNMALDFSINRFHIVFLNTFVK